MNLKEKKIKSDLQFKGIIFDLYEDEVALPNGKTGVRQYIKHPGGAAVIAVDKDNYVYLTEQFRYVYHTSLLEIPAGKIERGEDPKLAALRELKEETGLDARDITFLTKVYPTVGYTDEIIYVYLARDFDVSNQNLDKDEFINVVKIPFEQALQKVLNGEISDAKTQVALLMCSKTIKIV